MQRCENKEAADTRIAVHVQHALDKGHKQVFVRTVDTDVLVLLIGLFHDIIASYFIWIDSARGNMSNTSV